MFWVRPYFLGGHERGVPGQDLEADDPAHQLTVGRHDAGHGGKPGDAVLQETARPTYCWLSAATTRSLEAEARYPSRRPEPLQVGVDGYPVWLSCAARAAASAMTTRGPGPRS